MSLKYAVVERERRFLVSGLPSGVVSTSEIADRYLTGTRLRLREQTHADGRVVRKLTQKIRLTDGPQEVACTTLYLDEAEWTWLISAPARTLRKRRHLVERDGLCVAIDELEDGTLLAEIDDGDQVSVLVPGWLDVLHDVSGDESWTGASLAR